MTYNTTSKRIVGSLQILEDIENYDSDWNTFLKTEGMYMSQFIVSNNKAADGYNRQICLDRLGCITDNYNELQYLDSYNLASNRWTETLDVTLNNMVPYRTEIKDGQGNEYKDGIKDLSICWSSVKAYRNSTRDGWLNKGQDMWDDDYVRKRNIIKQTKQKKRMLQDVNSSTSKGSWGKEEVSVSYIYDEVLQDTDIIEYESSDEPMVPSYTVFMGLVSKGSGSNNALGYLNSAAYTLACADKTAKDRIYFPKLKFKKTDIVNDYVSFKIFGSKDYVENIRDTIGANVFFSNGNNFASGLVSNINIFETDEEIKNVFESQYRASHGNSKQYIYDNKILRDYYWSWDYEIDISMYINYQEIENNSVELVAQPVINSNAIVSYTKILRNSIVNCLNGAYDAYKNGGTMREEELDPENNYEKHIRYCNNSDINIANGAMQFLRYCVSDILPWVSGRAKALYNATTNQKNAQALVNIIKTRFNKSSGTFLQCYGSLLSLDAEYERIKNNKNNIDTSGLLVSRAKTNSADSTAFINQEDNPKYIDIDPIDSRFYSSANKFKAGDTVYVIGDGCVEFKSTVSRVSTIGLIESDFENAEQKEDGSIENILTTTEYATRIWLNEKLPDYYCKGTRVSNIRVMKLI